MDQDMEFYGYCHKCKRRYKESLFFIFYGIMSYYEETEIILQKSSRVIRI